MGLSLDIVVVGYRTPADMAAFMSSLKNNPSPVEGGLFAVEVGADEDGEWVWEAENGRYGSILHFADNIGYAAACNRAATLGDADIIGFFNADTAFLPGTLEDVLRAFSQNDHWSIIGPKQVNGRGQITHAGMFGSNRRTQPRGFQDLDTGQYDDVGEAITVSGSAYFIRRGVWNELTDCPLYREVAPGALGAFLPTRHYYEETWCSYHARAHGYKVVYLGTTKMIHEWHQASPVGGWAEKQLPESRRLFREACDHHGIEHD